MTKKVFLMAGAVLAGICSLSPVANAMPTTADADSTGASVDYSADNPANAAAAVLVEYNGDQVESLSAASAFGTNGAAAVATQESALSVGTSAIRGSIRDVVNGRGPRRENHQVNFGGKPDIAAPIITP